MSHTLTHKLARALACLAAAVMLVSAGAVVASAETLDVVHVISNDNMRAYESMSAKDIQAFLDTLPGPLKSLQTTDYAGHTRSAASIIASACAEYKISQKVMLTMLQKEQSLLTRTSLEKNTLSRAIGAGCPGGPTNRYPGFGQQMWNGARMLSGYGEGSSVYPVYYSGILKEIYKPATTGAWLVKKTTTVEGKKKTKYYLSPKNIATFKLYVYNPSVAGNSNFWTIYRRYFGSTFGNPQIRPVYRFYNSHYHTYLYTQSMSERYKLSLRKARRTWHYEGHPFSCDTSATTGTVPVYRYRNKKTGKYSFSASEKTRTSRTSESGAKTWRYQGVAFMASTTESSGAVTVWRLHNKKTGATLLTASAKSVAAKRTAAGKRTWVYQGVAYYLPRVPR